MTYERLPPEFLKTHKYLTQIASKISGWPVSYINVATEDGMMQASRPSFLAETLASFLTAASQGDHGFTTSVVADLAGTAPQSVDDFLLANREVLVGVPA